MRRLLPVTFAVLLALSAAGCGGGGDDGGDAVKPSHSSSAPDDGGFTVTDGSTPDELVSCLTDAGLEAATTDTTMLGVDDPHVQVRVEDMEGFEGPGSQGADLWVFADPAAAADNASYITLGGSDDPEDRRAKVVGNVVLQFDIITAKEPNADEAAVLGCLAS